MNKREALVNLYHQLEQQIRLYVKENLIDDEVLIKYWTDLEFNLNVKLEVTRTQRNEYVKIPMLIYCIDNEIVTDLGHKVFDAELDSLSEYDIRQKNEINYDYFITTLEQDVVYLILLLSDTLDIKIDISRLNFTDLWKAYLRLNQAYNQTWGKS